MAAFEQCRNMVRRTREKEVSKMPKKTTAAKAKRPKVKVSDLKPKKDAKGGLSPYLTK